jgi:hypothetical protein
LIKPLPWIVKKTRRLVFVSGEGLGALHDTTTVLNGIVKLAQQKKSNLTTALKRL